MLLAYENLRWILQLPGRIFGRGRGDTSDATGMNQGNMNATGTSSRMRGEPDDDDSSSFSNTNNNNNTSSSSSSSSSDLRINAMEEGKEEEAGGGGGGTDIPRAASDQSSGTCGESGDDYPTSPSNTRSNTNTNIGRSSDLRIDIVNDSANGGGSPTRTAHALEESRSGVGGGGGGSGGGTVRRADNIRRTNNSNSSASVIHALHSAVPPDEGDQEDGEAPEEEGEAQEEGEAHEEPVPGEDRNEERAGRTVLQVFCGLLGPFMGGAIGLPTLLHIVFPDLLSLPRLLTACSGGTIAAIYVRIQVLVEKNIISREDAKKLQSIFKGMGTVVVFCFGVSAIKVVASFV